MQKNESKLNDETNFRALLRELEGPDPWQLDSNPFERKRHEQMLRMACSLGTVANALEVGCAAGAFTEMLAPHCQRLTVVDVVPHAIARTRERMKAKSHVDWVVSDIRRFRLEEKFDLIVVAEVLYYLDSIAEMRAVIGTLAGMLAPAGQLVFGSARDANCRRWGHVAGAETVIEMLKHELVEIDRQKCTGRSSNEDCLIASFRKGPKGEGASLSAL